MHDNRRATFFGGVGESLHAHKNLPIHTINSERQYFNAYRQVNGSNQQYQLFFSYTSLLDKHIIRKNHNFFSLSSSTKATNKGLEINS